MSSLDISHTFTSFQFIGSVATACVGEKIWKTASTFVKKYATNFCSFLFFSTEMLFPYPLVGFFI